MKAKEFENWFNEKKELIGRWTVEPNKKITKAYSMGCYFDSNDNKIKHYRVDKMRGIEITDMRRDGKEYFDKLDMAAYTKMNFGMFGGEQIRVKLEFENNMVGVLLDRFGKDISILPVGKDGWSETSVDVALSDQFLGWIFSLGSSVKITGPEEVVSKFTGELKNLTDLYTPDRA